MTEYGLSRRQLVAVDCAVGLGYAVLVLVSASTATGLVAVGLAVPIAVRRIWPVPAFVFALVVSVAAVLGNGLRDPLLGAAYVLYVVALERRSTRPMSSRRLLGLSGGLGFVVLVLGVVAGAPAGQSRAAVVLTGFAALYGAWVLGQVVRDRRAAAARAAQVLAAQAVAAERLRIARELHDIVAHSMGLIAVKAGVANHVLKVRPEEVSDALSVIESTSRDALVELRHMLGLLRAPDDEPDDEPGDEPADLAPPAGLAALPELAARVESTGVHVDLRVDVPSPLPEAVGLTVHRIVRECLTNVTRHARARRCRITVTGCADAVEVEVVDDGVGGTAVEGHGLIGIRERVSVYGGTCRAGALPGGGFEVVVRLPHD